MFSRGRLVAAVAACIAASGPVFGAAVARVSCRDGEPRIYSQGDFERPKPFTANILCDADEMVDGRCVFQATVVRLQSAGAAPTLVNTKPLRVRAGRSRIIRVDEHAESVTSPGLDAGGTNIRLRVRCEPADR